MVSERRKLEVEPGKSVSACHESSDNEPEICEPLTNDNSDDESLKDVVQEVKEHTEYFAPNKNQIKKRKFVLVKVDDGSHTKAVYCYVAIV
ncbi:hypothetical protein ILUMI_03799 [Ignelater luminosus]|uniref:Uncharacterized protein n=1 Tax=Ignelater luminosus TaxID=2038154 RepID=A0A8K0GLT6_IGNLU|nr:hypothetical protein ILUMI_03799 [Ignelater luminosus]